MGRIRTHVSDLPTWSVLVCCGADAGRRVREAATLPQRLRLQLPKSEAGRRSCQGKTPRNSSSSFLTPAMYISP